MSEKVSISYSLRVPNGPSVGHTQELDVDGYQKLSLVLAKNDSKPLEVLPPGVKVALVVLMATPADAKVTYQADAGDVRGLDGPLVLIGPGASGLLGAPFPKLTFKNGTDGPAQIDVFIGRVS